jgi:hypothetical protein
MLVIPALRRLKQEDHEFEASQSYRARPFVKRWKEGRKGRKEGESERGTKRRKEGRGGRTGGRERRKEGRGGRKGGRERRKEGREGGREVGGMLLHSILFGSTMSIISIVTLILFTLHP